MVDCIHPDVKGHIYQVCHRLLMHCLSGRPALGEEHMYMRLWSQMTKTLDIYPDWFSPVDNIRAAAALPSVWCSALLGLLKACLTDSSGASVRRTIIIWLRSVGPKSRMWDVSCIRLLHLSINLAWILMLLLIHKPAQGVGLARKRHRPLLLHIFRIISMTNE